MEAKTTTHEDRVREFLAQRRIAVAGVSQKDGAHPAANLIYDRLKATGHQVFAVNPNLQQFDGDACWPEVGAIPGGVDGVVIVTRPELTERIVVDCVAAGVPRVWMHQSTPRGTSVSPKAAAECRAHGVSVITGACPMMYGDGVDLGHKCMRWWLGLSGGLPS